MLQKMRKKLGCKKGFTLIELIVVIAILGILAMIAIPRLSAVQEDARKAADIANSKSIATAISAANARGKIAETVSSAAALPSSGEIFDSFPNGYPTAQTTVVKGKSFTYTVDIGTGVVTVWVENGATDYQIYPTIDAIFK